MLNQSEVHEDHKNIVEQGFTLVELLIVIVILGILAGIVVFAVGNLTSDAKGNACQTDRSTFVSAYQAYKAHNGSSPAPTGANDAAKVASLKQILTVDTDKGGPFMQSWPTTIDDAHSGASPGAADQGKFTVDTDDGTASACTAVS